MDNCSLCLSNNVVRMNKTHYRCRDCGERMVRSWAGSLIYAGALGAVVLCLALVGCGSGPVLYSGTSPVAVRFDAAFSRSVMTTTGPSTERDILAGGLRYWDVVGAKLFLEEEAPVGAPVLFVRRIENKPDEAGDYDENTGLAAVQVFWTDSIDDLGFVFMQMTVAHEMGHAVGIRHHVTEGRALMKAVGTEALSGLQPADVAAFQGRTKTQG